MCFGISGSQFVQDRTISLPVGWDGSIVEDQPIIWPVLSWIALPTAMFGGYSLLRLLIAGNRLTPFQITWFRAGHAHAGILLVMSLIYYQYLERATLSASTKHAASAPIFLGIGAVRRIFCSHGYGRARRAITGPLGDHRGGRAVDDRDRDPGVWTAPLMHLLKSNVQSQQ